MHGSAMSWQTDLLLLEDDLHLGGNSGCMYKDGACLHSQSFVCRHAIVHGSMPGFANHLSCRRSGYPLLQAPQASQPSSSAKPSSGTQSVPVQDKAANSADDSSKSQGWLSRLSSSVKAFLSSDE